VSAGPAAAGVPEVVTVPRRRSRTSRTGAVPSRPTATVVLVVVSALFLVPIAAMVAFTFKGADGPTLAHWLAVFDPAQASNYDGLFEGMTNSAVLAVLTVAVVLLVLLPSMLLVELRYPRVRRVLEFVCLLPISIPTVVLVVGFVPVYQVIGAVSTDAWTLFPAIGIIVLPYAYRPIQANLNALQITTLSEAARSLGASWWSVVLRILLPNLRRGILSACFLTIAVVLGEFTIATFLSQNTFQTALLLLGQTDGYVSTICSVLSLLLVFVLLVVIGRLGSVTRSRRS
jgi:putative spermidine/putrescine transport system permease protein